MITYRKTLLLAASLFALSRACIAFADDVVSANEAALVKRGEYLARAADCMACHTARGGKPFAGGLPLQTPIGVIYSTNITPDKATGIGDYRYDDFDRALRHGVAKNGDTLYPAMPYPSYASVKPTDVKALYAYFMHAVPAVHRSQTANEIPWPLSVRWPLALWRHAFVPAAATDQVADASATDSQLARGRYLVESLGHCGACHTSRGTVFEEKALTDAGGSAFLSGAVVEQWFAKNLRSDMADGLGQWSDDDIVAFLRSGRNAHSAAFGGMSDVVQQSTQYLNDGDLHSIAAYLKSLQPAGTGSAQMTYDDTAAKALHAGELTSPGARIFVNNCAACHRTDGKGYAAVFPRLALSSTVNSSDPTSLIHIVLRGSAMPGTPSAPTSFAMPGFSQRLSDQQVADVVSFIRSSWGNHAPSVNASTVSKVRAHTE